MRCLLALSTLLCACNSFVAASDAGDSGISQFDAPIGQPDGSFGLSDGGALTCADWALAPLLFDPCVDVPIVTESLILDMPGLYRFDTDTGVLRDPADTIVAVTTLVVNATTEDAMVMVVGNFQLSADSSLRVAGSRSLLIVSWNSIQVDGEIDLSSTASQPGAGANSVQCNAATPGTSGDNGGGGGAGGGFGEIGGAGGTGSAGTVNNPGGDPGLALPENFHGGCAGSVGGLGNGGGLAGSGSGGGAVFLSARSDMGIAGKIHAGGEGGRGSNGTRAGGGGGGSGGYIGLESNVLTLQAGSVLASNGGAGGGGANQSLGSNGEDGQASTQSAVGGQGELSPEGDGGNGGSLVSAGQSGADAQRGAGGGGGGVGVIQIRSKNLTNDTASISPAASNL